MRPHVIFGVLLIAIGIAGLLIDNVSFAEKPIVEAAPLKVVESRPHSIPVPTIAGVIALLAAAGLLVVDRRQRN